MIKVGDIVRIIDIGEIYPTYKEMCDLMGLNYESTRKVNNGDEFKVIDIRPHLFLTNTTVVGLRNNTDVIIGLSGIEFVRKSNNIKQL